MVVVALLSVDLVESVDLVSVDLVVNCIFILDCSGPGRKGGLVPGVSPDGFDDGGESKAVVDDYKFKLQKAEQDINTLQTSVARLESQVLR